VIALTAKKGERGENKVRVFISTIQKDTNIKIGTASPSTLHAKMVLTKYPLIDQAYLSTDQCGVYLQSSSEKGTTLSLLPQRN
jgi:hypothetical protein